jgi:hypothetical protein
MDAIQNLGRMVMPSLQIEILCVRLWSALAQGCTLRWTKITVFWNVTLCSQGSLQNIGTYLPDYIVSLTGWHGNILDSCSGESQFDISLDISYPHWRFSWFYPVAPGKCQDIILIRPRLLPSKSPFICHPSSQCYIVSELLKALLNNPQTNTNIIHSVILQEIVILIFITMRTSNITLRWPYGPNFYIYSEILIH